MSLETKSFEFADFRLDEEEKVLLRDGQPVSITPKAFQLLLVLVKNCGRPVKKSELMREIWADSFVEEGNLTFTINLLRKALGDDRHNPRFVETIPKHGYRFIAEVTAVDQNQSLQANQSQPQNRKISFFSEYFAHQNYLFPVLALIILFIGTISLWFYSSDQQKSIAKGKKSILVLPLKPIDTANRDELYEIGIAESIIQRLSTIKDVAVRPLSAIRQYKGIEQDSLAAGREQRVEYVLASNYQIVGGKIRVTSQLLNVETGLVEETYKSEKEISDVFAMQDAVSEDMGQLLRPRFAAPVGSPRDKRGTNNEEAYRLYLQAMALLDKENKDDSKRAIDIFDQALVLDPNYGKAWAGKARAHCNFAHSGGNTPDAEFAKAKPALERAFALDSNLAEAHAVLGIIKTDYDWDFAEGEKQFRRAIELSPNSDIFYRWFANRLAAQGRGDEAIAMVKNAIDLNPNHLAHQIFYGRILYYDRRFNEAAAQLERVAEIDSNNPLLYNFLWRCYQMQGDYRRAYESFMKFQRLTGTKDDDLKTYENSYAKGGWQSVLLKNLEIVKANDANGTAAFTLALLSVLTENREQSLHYLNEAIKNRSLGIPVIKGDPAFDFLRGDARFEELLENINSKYKV